MTLMIFDGCVHTREEGIGRSTGLLNLALGERIGIDRYCYSWMQIGRWAERWAERWTFRRTRASATCIYLPKLAG